MFILIVVRWQCHVWLLVTPWTAAHYVSLSFTVSWSLLKHMSIELVMLSNHHILCHPLLLPTSIFPSIKIFSKESALPIRWPKYWSFTFSAIPSNEYSGLISFRIDWFDLLAVQGTLKCLLQHYSSKASILQCSAFFVVQLSHPYMTTGKTIALAIQTCVGKGISLLFNMLSRFVIAFPTRRRHLLISWLQSPSAVILEPKKIKVYGIVCRRMDRTQHTVVFMAMIYCSEGVQRKVSKGKSRRTKSRGSQVQVCKHSFPMESHRTFLSLLAMSCDEMCELSMREAH